MEKLHGMDGMLDRNGHLKADGKREGKKSKANNKGARGLKLGWEKAKWD